jgi:hypothetical protein
MFGCFEVDSDGLDMAYMEVAVGFMWEPKSRLTSCDGQMLLSDGLGVALYLELPGLDLCDFMPELIVVLKLRFAGEFGDTVEDKFAVDCGVLIP